MERLIHPPPSLMDLLFLFLLLLPREGGTMVEGRGGGGAMQWKGLRWLQ